VVDITNNTPLGIATEGILQAPNDPYAAAVAGIAKSKELTYVAKLNDIILGGSASVQFIAAEKERSGGKIYRKRKKKQEYHIYVWSPVGLRSEALKTGGEAVAEFIPYVEPEIYVETETPPTPVKKTPDPQVFIYEPVLSNIGFKGQSVNDFQDYAVVLRAEEEELLLADAFSSSMDDLVVFTTTSRRVTSKQDDEDILRLLDLV